MHQLQCPRQKPKDLDKNMSVRDTSIGIAGSFVTAGSAFGIAVLAMDAFFFFFFFFFFSAPAGGKQQAN